ncbi:MAG TPA: ACT domain-containing protein [Myxococcaceae bacterium]|nr:ACT domain-containing protein [Myxococcaceae bacterium]
MPQLIVTAVGPDRPGLVADFTRHLYEVGASLADSRMVNLRGHFSLLALVEGPAEALAALRRTLGSGSTSLGLRFEMYEAGATDARASGSVPYRLKVYASDQIGIAARVTSLLRQHSVNVEELETRIESAPFAGTPLFVLEGVVTLPQGTSVRKVRDELQELGDKISCDIDLDPV